jgi:hypothetical protein
MVRFLSAYLDKIVRHASNDTRRAWSFEDFVSNVEEGLEIMHWNPQCALVDCFKWLPRMDFIGSFENIADDTEKLLKSLGAWENFGESGWGTNGSEAIFRGGKNRAHSGSADSQARELCSP